MTMILMERMKKALSLALVLLMVFCSVSAVAEELDFVVLEAVDDYGEEAIQLVEMEIQTEEVGEPEQTIELIDLQEAEEPEIQEPEELMAESETIEIVQVTLEEPQEETPVAEESEPIQLT
jgi:outer membrane biosynthesis protein TonB